ncbi:MAG TPA: universal stress protein [Smithella sp.]|nr:universal stress protein [Smithella sp.]MDM7987033.1 universal stress protein [Smithella sp.]HNY50129.1 universal stress protein [Smithella sp.]HOG89554.1 universal stress protein [Smithella sp.]HOU49890.1 universal stress protein [Smithella sp.]
MIKKILVPIDGSANSNTALEYGIYIARKMEASLTGLHVIDVNLIQGPILTDISGAVGMPPYEGFFDAIEKSLQEKADFILKEFQERCRKAVVKSDVRKEIGKVSAIIIEEAKNADLILMARKGEHFHLKEGGLLGSVAGAVVRNSGKPVLVTPEKFIEIESMGLAYDGSAPAIKALNLSLQLSRQNVWPLTVLIVTTDLKKAADLIDQIEEANQKEAPVVDCETITVAGKEADEIIKFIREGSVELMVMGAYGHNRLRELLLGSTTSHVINKSPIPVLLAR